MSVRKPVIGSGGRQVDPDIQRRNRGSKRRGANFEIKLTEWWRSLHWEAERISRKGNRDEGDVVVWYSDNDAIIIEAKNAARLSLPEWLKQANIEAARFAEHRSHRAVTATPVVVVKRRNHGIDKSYVVMELDTFEKFLR